MTNHRYAPAGASFQDDLFRIKIDPMFRAWRQERVDGRHTDGHFQLGGGVRERRQFDPGVLRQVTGGGYIGRPAVMMVVLADHRRGQPAAPGPFNSTTTAVQNTPMRTSRTLPAGNEANRSSITAQA